VLGELDAPLEVAEVLSERRRPGVVVIYETRSRHARMSACEAGSANSPGTRQRGHGRPKKRKNKKKRQASLETAYPISEGPWMSRGLCRASPKTSLGNVNTPSLLRRPPWARKDRRWKTPRPLKGK
jgi:hypothetical protein